MDYVYNTIISKDTKTISRYGLTYKLEKRFRMGRHTFVSFVHPGVEKILLVQDFALQYEESQKIVQGFGKFKTLEAYINLIKQKMGNRITVEEYEDTESKTKMMHVLTVIYKDISIVLEYKDHNLTQCKEFTIVDHNIFGNGTVVPMDPDEE